jgi:hypothetical protein
VPQILAEISLEPGDLPHHSTLVKAFDWLQMKIWRMLLRLSAQLHDTADHAAMNATFFDRETANKHYCRRTNYRVGLVETLLRNMTSDYRGIRWIPSRNYIFSDSLSVLWCWLDMLLHGSQPDILRSDLHSDNTSFCSV